MTHKLHLSKRARLIAVFISVSVALLMIGIALAATVVIDDFSNTSQKAIVAWTPIVQSACVYSSSVTSALGNTREISITKYNGGNESDDASFQVDSGAKRLSFSTSSGISATGLVIFDGIDNTCALDNQGLNGVDLTGGGTNVGFRVRVPSNDLNGVLMMLKVYTGTNWSAISVTLPPIATGQLVDFFLPFSKFTTQGGTGAVFTSTGAVVLLVNNDFAPGADTLFTLIDATSDSDLGDLPETLGPGAGPGNYAGLVISSTGGARHVTWAGLRLGGSVDVETDGQPSVDANGDDAVSGGNIDDEDGVVFTPGKIWKPGLYSASKGGSVRVTVNGRVGACTGSARCRVSGWIDWNNNGQLEPYERILSGATNWATASAGGGGVDAINTTYDMAFNIPTTVTVSSGTYYARFRLCGSVDSVPTTSDCNTPGGASQIGEVEDYKWTFNTDFGDLPETSGTAARGNYAGLVLTTTGEGAGHVLGSNLRLGATVDAETTGYQSVGAKGDDLNGSPDDEDGVSATKSTWTAPSGGGSGSVSVIVNGEVGACSEGYPCSVNGWIDWNNDGDFDDSGEMIIDGSVQWDSNVTPGAGYVSALATYLITFNIPGSTNLSTESYYARFRLCGGTGAVSGVNDCNTPSGLSQIGEVEDYYIEFGWLAANLGSFTAVSAGDHNALAWETTSELNNLGFNVRRGVSASGPDVKLNPYVIPSQAPGGTDGFAYTYNDFAIAGGVTYYYWLEDVDLKGTVTQHGPVQVIVANAPTAVTVTTLQAGSSTSALPFAALGLALLVGAGIVVGRRRH